VGGEVFVFNQDDTIDSWFYYQNAVGAGPPGPHLTFQAEPPQVVPNAPSAAPVLTYIGTV
jgi:hypothetical protein